MRTLLMVAAGALALGAVPLATAAQDEDGPIATAPGVHGAPESPPPEPPSPPPQTYTPPAHNPPPQSYSPPAPTYSPPAPTYQPAPTPAPQAYQPPPAPPPSEQAAPAAGGQALAVAASGRTPPFMAVTAGRDALAGPLSIVGAAAAISLEQSDGAKIVSANDIADPAPAIAHKLADALAARGGYAVKVSTTSWGFAYYLLDWNRYHLLYEGEARLVDARSGRVVAHASCTHKPNGETERLSYQDLTDNGAAGLKSGLAGVVDECAHDLADKLARR